MPDVTEDFLSTNLGSTGWRRSVPRTDPHRSMYRDTALPTERATASPSPRTGRTATFCALACLLAMATLGCSSHMKYGIDQSEIRDNPHPTQRYEVVVTSDAPGPWGSVSGAVFYHVTNDDCVPKLPLEGARQIPNTARKFKLTTTDGKTWKGYFYRQMIEDADYFGLGVCHWDIESVGTGFIVHGGVFGPALVLQDMLVPKTYKTFFKKSEFIDTGITGDASEWPASYKESMAEVAKDPDAYFPMTITVREVKP